MLLALGLLGFGAPALAQSSSPAPEQAPAPVLPTVKVESSVEDEEQRVQGPSQVLEGRGLRMRATGTLGATLGNEPGVANASFGPNVGLPVIRGQSGSRVQVMLGGLGAHDASAVSADHGVMLEPAMAERITVHRGPAAIRFGGGAIGGAVEVEQGRMPETRPRSLQTQVQSRHGIDSRVQTLRLDGPGTERTAWHVDVHGRHKGNTRIPGLAIDEDAVRRQFFLVSGRNTDGYIANSEARSEGGSVGASHFFDTAWLGLSLSTLRMDYGIPPGAHSHAHGNGPVVSAATDENARIAARQHRLELRGEFDMPWEIAPTLRLRAVDSRYHHDELALGVPQTRFRNDVQEVRLELEHQLLHSTEAQWGLHLQNRDFAAVGAEAFVPQTDVRQAALFATHRWDAGSWTIDAGARAQWQQSRPGVQRTNLGLEVTLPERRFEAGSFSLAVGHPVGNGDATLTWWHASRVPDVQELYALGPHLATRTYDFGNSTLQLERLRGLDLTVHQHLGSAHVHASGFLYDIADHIYQRNLGVFYDPEKQQFRALCAQLDQCLPVTRYEQAAARFHGIELEITQPLHGTPFASAAITAFADKVRGRLPGLGQDVPRQPPARFGLRFEATQGAWSGELQVVRHRAQKHPGENETPTAGATQVHASLRWETRSAAGTELALYVVGRNLGNRELRSSTSFLRNYAPEPGRTVEVGLEARF